MIDFASRVEDVTGFLQSNFGVKDRQLVELLLIQRLKTVHPIWIILDTDCFQVEFSQSWLSLGSHSEHISSLPTVRSMRAQKSRPTIEEWVATRKEFGWRLFIEPDWKAPKSLGPNFRQHELLVQSCVRVKSVYPKVDLIGLPPNTFYELNRLVRLAVAEEFRDTLKLPPRPPNSILYYAELVQSINPDLRDWNDFISNIAYILLGRRTLYGEDYGEDGDLKLAARVLTDSVPYWTKGIIKVCEKGKGEVVRMRAYAGGKQFWKILVHLCDNDIIRKQQRGAWKLSEGEDGLQGNRVIKLIDGDLGDLR